MNIEDINVEKELTILFMGTPEFSKIVLEGLLKQYKIRAVVTKPDRPSGRNLELKYSPVKRLAQKNQILVLQPEDIYYDCNEIIDLEPDLIITCAYGQKLPVELLQLPKLGCINIHASLLPKLRGGAPIHRAIIEGYKKTGITIMYMAEAMDTGDIISQKEVEITDDDTAATLHDKLAYLGRDLILETLPSIINKTNKRRKQNSSESTYAVTIQRKDEKIQFTKTKKQILNQIRGLNSWPGAYVYFEDKVMKIWAGRETDKIFSDKFNGEITSIYSDGFGVRVSNGEIVITELQLEGKSKMRAVDFMNGHQNLVGKVLR